MDKRKLRTPLGTHFIVPTEALAQAVAVEWDTQHKVINRHLMHMVPVLLFTPKWLLASSSFTLRNRDISSEFDLLPISHSFEKRLFCFSPQIVHMLIRQVSLLVLRKYLDCLVPDSVVWCFWRKHFCSRNELDQSFSTVCSSL